MTRNGGAPAPLTLKTALGRRKKSGYWLSKQTGLPQTTIKQYIRGERLPDVNNAIKIAEALNYLVEEITWDKPQNNPSKAATK